MSNDNSPANVSADRFDEFKCRVLDALKDQYELSKQTNATVGQNTTHIEVLKAQMANVLDHVKTEQQRARETKIAKITGYFALVGTIITAAVAWFKG